MQDSRKKVSMQTVIGEVCGAVSLCWNPKPTGVFDSEQATKFVNEAIAEVQAGIEQYVLEARIHENEMGLNWQLAVKRGLEEQSPNFRTATWKANELIISQFKIRIAQLRALQAKEANDESS